MVFLLLLTPRHFAISHEFRQKYPLTERSTRRELSVSCWVTSMKKLTFIIHSERGVTEGYVAKMIWEYPKLMEKQIMYEYIYTGDNMLYTVHTYIYIFFIIIFCCSSNSPHKPWIQLSFGAPSNQKNRVPTTASLDPRLLPKNNQR